ncbi:ABC transporter ATP-binding protein [Hymenobacter fastidiosus]|uniref:ABC transporter ATP-binding protein n=1 Tax=Hymenobacter fastidiosus TaxID=486264 RepID=A0ABP7SNG7_9BACT
MNFSTSYLLKRSFDQARPHWLYIAGIFICNFFTVPITLMKPLALKILIDSGFGAKPVPNFITFFFPSNYEFSFASVIGLSISLVIFVALIDNIYIVVIWLLNTYTGERLVRDFRLHIFNHIQQLSLAYHDRKGTAESVYKIQYDAYAIRTLIIENLSPILSSFITLTGMIVVMLNINWHFAIIACSVIPPMAILIRFSSKKLKKEWQKVKENESNAMSVIQEVLTSLRVVKAFGQENGESGRFMSKTDMAMKGQLKVAWIDASFYFCIGMTYAIGTALFIFLGAKYVYSGEMTLGELTMVMTYLGQIYGPLDTISRNLNEVQSSLVSLGRVYSLLDEEKEVKEIANPVNFIRANGLFEFHNVSFHYKKETSILNDLSFKIYPGDRVGIIGSTGAGKSTLISLITRFYDPTYGQILVDGVNIKEYKLSDYRKQFSIVLQEPVLFSTTIGENIAYGLPNASKAEITEAAKMANAHNFIINYPDGYDTLTGERGMNLSGGERQRISIARAFIKNAPILILDEPTSSLDVKNESQIMEAMERLVKGRTTFLITHRLDMLNSCNIILHLEKGCLEEIIINNETDTIARIKATFLSSI